VVIGSTGGESTDPPVRFAGLLPLLADGGPHPLVAALRPTPRVAHLAAARGAPGSEFTPYSPGAALEVGYFGAETRQVLGALRYLSTTRALDAVKAAVEACFGVELRVVEVGEGAVIGTMIECRPRGRSTWLPLREMGTGLSHALPLIVQCACLMHPAEGMPWPTLLTCEEPEAHCHPVVQAALADVAIDAALAGDTSVMVETHSETFVLRVRRRVAEGRLPPSKVAIYWVDNEGAATRVSRLSLDERGRISDWPEGWFDAALHEVSAIHRAMVREG
jgi:hypothetical protein